MEISKNIQVKLPVLEKIGVQLFIKREDLLHPYISGNKYRKLKYNIEEAKKNGNEYLLTFGGAYSNHILATAAVGKEFGFNTIGVVRGEELGVDLEKTLTNNPTLKQASDFGMNFLFVTRSEYQQKKENSFLEKLSKKHPNSYVIPEGGTNELAIKGCEEILTEDDAKFTHVCCAMGTGGTVTGIINSSSVNQRILVFPSLKGAWVQDELKNLKPNKENWQIVSDYHFGGYAKTSDELITFINDFKRETSVPLDPVYTGKLMFGLLDMIQNDQFKRGSKILAIHTGGLQGISGMNMLLKKKNKNTIQ